MSCICIWWTRWWRRVRHAKQVDGCRLSENILISMHRDIPHAFLILEFGAELMSTNMFAVQFALLSVPVDVLTSVFS